MSSQIPAIPSGASGEQLIAQLNDRFRRISQLGAGTPGPAGPQGPAGAAGAGSSGIATILGVAVPNAVSQTLTDFQGDNLDVRMFGCVVDGATDDTTAFQTAMNTAATLGIPLMIPGDNILICRRVVIPTGLTLVSRGLATIKQKASSAAANTPWIVTAAGQLNPWASATAYTLGTLIIDPAGHAQQCTTAGTSGGSIPTFNDTGGTTPDGAGALVWTDEGIAGNIAIEGITFDGNSAHQGAVVGAHILQLVNTTKVRLHNCNWQNTTGRCITGYSITDLEIRGGRYINWQTGNVGAIHIEAQEGGPVIGIRISDLLIDCGNLSSGIKLGGEIPYSPLSITWTRPIRQIALTNITVLNPVSGGLGVELWTDTPGGAFSDFQLDRISVIGTAGASSGSGISLAGCGGTNGSLTNLLVENCGIGLELMTSNATVDGAVILGSWQTCVSIDASATSISNLSLLNVVMDASALGSSVQRACTVYAAATSPYGNHTVTGVIIGPGCQVINLPSNCWGFVVQTNAANCSIVGTQILGVRVTGVTGATGNVGIVIINYGGSSALADNTTISVPRIEGPIQYGISTNTGATNTAILFPRLDSAVTTPISMGPSDTLLSIPGGTNPGPLVGGDANSGGYPLKLVNTSNGNLAQFYVEWLGSNWPMIAMIDGSSNPLLQFRFDPGEYCYLMTRVGIQTTSPLFDCHVNGTLGVAGNAYLSGAFGCNGATPQTPWASGGAFGGIPVNTGVWGFASASDFNSMKTLLNNIWFALVHNGIMS